MKINAPVGNDDTIDAVDVDAARRVGSPSVAGIIHVRRFFGRRNKMTCTFVESNFICYAVLLHSVSGERRIRYIQIKDFYKMKIRRNSRSSRSRRSHHSN